MTKPLRIAVLASGRGSNLAALLAARGRGELSVDPVLVASDKAKASALVLAKEAGIPTLTLSPKAFADRAAFDHELFGRIAEADVELIVLAGFMRIIDAGAIAPWIGRMINIHPSLLPKYPGLHTHRRCLDAGDAEHGASVHYVTAELDGGPVIAQARIAVHTGDDENSLARRLLDEEHRLLPAVIEAIAQGTLCYRAPHGTCFRGQALDRPLHWTGQELTPDRE